MNNKNEETILFMLKYAPPMFIIVVSIIIFLSLYSNSHRLFQKEKLRIEQEFIQENKTRIKEEVTNIYKYILTQQKNAEKNLKDNLKERVYQAYNVAKNIYEENKDLGKEKVKKMIKDALRKATFGGGKGYFYIHSLDYECILLPPEPHLEGKSFFNYQDAKGKYVTRELVAKMKKSNEAFDEWWYIKPNDSKKEWFKKLGFIKHFEPYDWFIGTGEYMQEHEKKLQKNILSYLKNLDFYKNRYVFALDENMNYLNHLVKNYIGKNAFDISNVNEKILRQFQDIIKTKKAKFITYIQHLKPNNKKDIEKISYVTNIPKWNWIIGKGFYTDDIQEKLITKKELLDEELKRSINELAIYAAVLSITILFISVYISRLLESRFKKYKLEIQENIEEMNKKDSLLTHQGKMAAIGEMIGNIAHQWRQPLSLISTASSSLKLKKELNILEDKEFNENLDYINSSTKYLSQTIDDFRDFFSKDKEYVEFTIEEILNDTLKIIGAQFKNKDISIHQNLNSTKIKGLKTEFIQVVINILNNSKDELIKHKKQKKFIIIDTMLKEKKLFLFIKDNAGGAQSEVLKNAFKPYFTKGKKDGTGIGLYMSKSIIEKHMNGKISMQNSQFKFQDELHKGALTIIELPIST